MNLTDVIKVLPPICGSGSADPQYSARSDLAPDGLINITDLLSVVRVLPPIFGSVCS